MEGITTPPTIEELQASITESAKTIEELRAKEQSRAQQIQTTSQQLQQRLQQESAAVVNTMGQIAMLEDMLVTQKASMNRTEGMIQALNSM